MNKIINIFEVCNLNIVSNLVLENSNFPTERRACGSKS